MRLYLAVAFFFGLAFVSSQARADAGNRSFAITVPLNAAAQLQIGADALREALAQQGARAQSGAASSMSAQAADAGSTGGDTTVNLSGLSGQLRSVSASGDADIDTGLVQSIKDALNNGTLTIDANKIADGVLNTARELLQQQRPGS